MAIPDRQPGTPVVVRLMFAPVRFVSRRLAPRVSTRLFETLWRVIDREEEPPRAEEREQPLPKLAAALALQGACNAMVGGLLDHVARRQFARLTGYWPGRTAKS